MAAGKVGKRIKDTLIGLIKKSADVVENTAEVTRGATIDALRHVRGKKAEASRRVAEEIVEGAIEAGSEAGAELGSVAKGAIIGAVGGVGEVTQVDKGIISGTAQAAIKRAVRAGGDLIGVATKVVEGAIEVADRAGMKGEDAAMAAISGAIEAAESISEATATTVAKALSMTFTGVRMAFGLPKKKPTILTLDSNRSNLELLSQQLIKEGYETLGVASLEELDQALLEGRKIALGLIDLSGFDQRIWERCQALHRAKIPFIVISPQRSPLVQRDSMRCGASGLLVKPLGTRELLEYIRTLLGE